MELNFSRAATLGRKKRKALQEKFREELADKEKELGEYSERTWGGCKKETKKDGGRKKDISKLLQQTLQLKSASAKTHKKEIRKKNTTCKMGPTAVGM